MGDVSGIELPKMGLDEKQLMEEKQMAKYAQSAEFKRVVEHFQERIKFYQTYLPDGRPIATAPQEDLEKMWVIANIVIAEFNQVIDMYKYALEAVQDEKVLSSWKGFFY